MPYRTSFCSRLLIGVSLLASIGCASAQLIVDGIAARGDETAQARIRDRVAAITDRFPVPGLPQTLAAGGATV